MSQTTYINILASQLQYFAGYTHTWPESALSFVETTGCLVFLNRLIENCSETNFGLLHDLFTRLHASGISYDPYVIWQGIMTFIILHEDGHRQYDPTHRRVKRFIEWFANTNAFEIMLSGMHNLPKTTKQEYLSSLLATTDLSPERIGDPDPITQTYLLADVNLLTLLQTYNIFTVDHATGKLSIKTTNTQLLKLLHAIKRSRQWQYLKFIPEKPVSSTHPMALYWKNLFYG